MLQNHAEAVGLKTLAWLAGHEELLGVFMGSTGASANDLRERAGDAEFLGSVLDFVLMDDAWVVQVCDAHAWDYTDIAEARAALPGGGEVNWT